jgi:hypothetical protein
MSADPGPFLKSVRINRYGSGVQDLNTLVVGVGYIVKTV